MRSGSYFISCLLALLAVAAFGQTKQEGMQSDKRPLTCKLTSLEMQKRKATVIAELKSMVLQKSELDHGFRYTFESKDTVLDKLMDFIKSERQCCDFFVYQLTIENETAILNLTGPAGAKEFIKEEVGL